MSSQAQEGDDRGGRGSGSAAPEPVPRWRPPESRPLKLLGLAFAAGGLVALTWAFETLTNTWQQAGTAQPLVLWVALGSANLLAAGLLMVAAGCGAARSLRHPGRRRSLALQVLGANVLVPAVLIGVFFDDTSSSAGRAFGAWELLALPLAYGLLWAAWRLWRRSRRHEALGAGDVLARDKRPPVLYLRSFREDGEALVEDGAMPWQRQMMRVAAATSAEELMAEILDRLGPVIAIGKPGEDLPELGAARLYVPHDEWQHRVSELMRAAALVVVRIGASPGVRWEIEQALTLIPRQRLVLAVLGADEVAPELLARLAGLLGPDFATEAAPKPRRAWQFLLHGLQVQRIGTLVCFAADGRPHKVTVQREPVWRWRRGNWPGFRPYHAPLAAAWQQVFVHLQLPWRHGPQRSRAVAVALALSLGFVGAQWFYLGQRKRGFWYVASSPLLLAPVFLSLGDALRFILLDRAAFDALASPPGDPR